MGSFATVHSMTESNADILRNSPLHYACLNGSVELVRQLIARGANPSALNGESETPMYFAIRSIPVNGSRSVEIINLLLTAGCKPDSRNMKLESPLHFVKQLDQQHESDSELSRLLAQVTALLKAFGARPLRPRMPHEWD